MASEIEKLQLEEAEAMEALAAEGAELLKQSEALEQRRLSIQAKFESERESLRSSTSAEAPPPPKTSLWEREEALKHEAEAERAARIAKLDAQRAAELEEAKARDAARAQAEIDREREEEARRAAQRAEKAREAEERAAANSAARERSESQMSEDQARLSAERARQEEKKAAKNAPAQMPETADFAYKFAEGMEKTIKTFRQRGGGGDTLVLRIEHERDMIEFDEQLKKASLDDIQELLDETEPRYILHIHEVGHRDGRKTFPIAFILFLPSHVPVHKKVLYTRPVSDLCTKFAVNKHITLEDPEDLDVEWLEKQLQVKK